MKSLFLALSLSGILLWALVSTIEPPEGGTITITYPTAKPHVRVAWARPTFTPTQDIYYEAR